MVDRPNRMEYADKAAVLSEGNLVVISSQDTIKLPGVKEVFTTPTHLVLHLERGKVKQIASQVDIDHLSKYVLRHRQQTRNKLLEE